MLIRPVLSLGKAAINRGSNIISKVLNSRTTLEASDLSTQTFKSVLGAIEREGLKNVKILPTRTGGNIIQISDIRRPGLINLFPGGVMHPTGKLDKVSLSFNEAGDMLQLTGLQKANGCVAGSTIRTAEGISHLKRAGVANPAEYVQVHSGVNLKGGKDRWVNKTFSPFGDTPKSVPTPQVEQKVITKVADDTKSSVNSALKREANSANSISRDDEALENTLFNQRIISRNLETVNPALNEKVMDKINKLSEIDPSRAEKFSERLIERYENNVGQFAKKSDSDSFFDRMSDDLDIWNQRAADDYYSRISSMADDLLNSSTDDFFNMF